MNEQHHFPSFNGGTCVIGHFYKKNRVRPQNKAINMLLRHSLEVELCTSRDIVRLTTNFDRFAVKAKFPVSS